MAVAVQAPIPQLGIAKDLLEPAKGKLHLGLQRGLVPFRLPGGTLRSQLEAAAGPDGQLPVQIQILQSDPLGCAEIARIALHRALLAVQ